MPTQPLAAERAALSEILSRLMAEISDLETLCKHVPRVVATAVTTARVQAALSADAEPESQSTIRKLLAEVSAEEGESTW
ncbi:MAG: hypothetical protein KC435_07070 [Thermomicrobiales bacterium]|nr:hypothetical protein [Thermomicrobiales bacterium]